MSARRGSMLDRVESPVLALGLLLVLPTSSVRSMMLDRVRNPVLALELSKHYKSKAYIVSERIIYSFSCLFLCWFVLFFVVILYHCSEVHQVNYGLTTYDFLTHTWGRQRSLFAVFLTLPVFFMVPVLAVASVVGERQRGTLMFVQLSLLRPFDIVWGKVVASIALVLFPAGVLVFTHVLIVLLLLACLFLDSPLPINAVVTGSSSTVLGGLVVLTIVFAVPAVSVLISTFTKSSAAAGVTAIAVNCCGIAIFYVDLMIGDVVRFSRLGLLVALFVLSFMLGVVCAAVWWACMRLRLPAK